MQRTYLHEKKKENNSRQFFLISVELPYRQYNGKIIENNILYQNVKWCI